MEKELNIAAILKEKSKGTKLWSPIFGDCKLSRLTGNGIRVFSVYMGYTSKEEKSFFNSGKYTIAGEVCLFPSAEMQDWSKFAWKKGDVLTTNDKGRNKIFCIFTGWATDDYTLFTSEWQTDNNFLKWERYYQYDTKRFHLANDLEIDEYFFILLARYGEKVKFSKPKTKHPEFKDGDIVFSEGNREIAIFKRTHKDTYDFYACLSDGGTICYDIFSTDMNLRPATDSEKQQLFGVLAKEGKKWNPTTKQIEDLPKKYEFKAFDKVLVRDTKDEVWTPNFFSNLGREWDEYKYGCISGGTIVCYCKYCIPYNDQTKHLLGTTDEWKGGEL